jgi:hypothetical protein
MGITEEAGQAEVALDALVVREFRGIVEGDGMPGSLGRDGEETGKLGGGGLGGPSPPAIRSGGSSGLRRAGPASPQSQGGRGQDLQASPACRWNHRLNGGLRRSAAISALLPA